MSSATAKLNQTKYNSRYHPPLLKELAEISLKMCRLEAGAACDISRPCLSRPYALKQRMRESRHARCSNSNNIMTWIPPFVSSDSHFGHDQRTCEPLRKLSGRTGRAPQAKPNECSKNVRAQRVMSVLFLHVPLSMGHQKPP